MKDKIIQISKYHTIHALYAGDKIPYNKLQNARQNFPIPNDEEIFVLYDATVFGSCKLGLAIGENGLYWKNDNYVKSEINSMSWDEFIECDLYNGDKKNHIEFADGAIFNSVAEGDKIFSFLEELQDLVSSEYGDEEEEYEEELDDEDEEELDDEDEEELDDDDEYDEEELLEDAVYNCLEKYNIPRLLYDEKLKKVNFRELVREFYVPESDDLYAFFDSTVFGGCGNGMAITSSGLYWKNQWDKPGFLTWDSFYKTDIVNEGDSDIKMGKDDKIFNTYAQMKNYDFLLFLLDLKIEMINTVKPTIKNAFIRCINNPEFDVYIGNIEKGKFHGKGTLVKNHVEKEGIFEKGKLVYDSKLNKAINLKEEELFEKVKREKLEIVIPIFHGESIFLENFAIKQEMLLSVDLVLDELSLEDFGSYSLRFLYDPNDEWNLYNAGFYVSLPDFMRHFPKILEWNDIGIKNKVSSEIIKPLFSLESIITYHKYTLEEEKYATGSLNFNFYFSGLDSDGSFFGLSIPKFSTYDSNGENINLNPFLIPEDTLYLLPSEDRAYDLVMNFLNGVSMSKEKVKSEYDLFK